MHGNIKIVVVFIQLSCFNYQLLRKVSINLNFKSSIQYYFGTHMYFIIKPYLKGSGIFTRSAMIFPLCSKRARV